MLRLLNPWVVVGVLVALLATGAGAYIKGGRDAVNAEAARAARDAQVAEIAYQAGQNGAASEISKLKVKHTTVRQTLEKETIRDPIYLGCEHNDVVLSLLNRRLQGPTGEPINSSELSRDPGPAQ